MKQNVNVQYTVDGMPVKRHLLALTRRNSLSFLFILVQNIAFHIWRMERIRTS